MDAAVAVVAGGIVLIHQGAGLGRWGSYHYQAPIQAIITGSAMQDELSFQPQVSQGWLLLGHEYSYTSLSRKGPYHATHIGFRALLSVPCRRVATPSHEGRLAGQLLPRAAPVIHL